MIFRTLVAALAAGVTAFALQDGDILENRYIIEFDLEKAPLDHLGKRESLHGHFYNHLSARDVPYVLDHEYSLPFYAGAAVTIRDPEHLSHLENYPAVRKVWPVIYVEGPKPVPLARDATEYDDAVKRATESERYISTESEDAPLEKRQARFTQGYGTEQDFGVLSQIPALQAADVRRTYKGAGVKVGIIDSGVDYLRSTLGGAALGQNTKVVGGTNYLADPNPNVIKTDQQGTNQVRNDPFDSCNGHGTFVASLTAAVSGAGNPYSVPGVASDAKIYAYKIFDCTGGADSSLILAAMAQAVADGCSVINMSLGSASGWTQGSLNSAATQFVNQGKHFAGNSGANGLFYSAQPAGGAGISVGASTGPTYPYYEGQMQIDNTNTRNPVRFNIRDGIYTGRYRIYVASGNICNGVSQTFAPGDRVIVFAAQAQSQCDGKTASDKVGSAGGVGVVLYEAPRELDDSETQAGPVIQGYFFYSNGKDDVIAAYNANPNNLYINFPSEGSQPGIIPQSTFRTPTAFTERGPTTDLAIVPNVMAPGSNIFSTHPSAIGSWSVGAGTSYASPLVAGAVALMVQAKPAITPLEVKERLMATAKLTNARASTDNRGNMLDSVAVQGAGNIQLDDALNTNTLISPTMLALNDTKYPQYTKFVVITNTGNTQNTYTLSHTPASTMYTYKDGQPSDNPDYLSDTTKGNAWYASVKFSRTSVSLAAGQRAMLLMTFSSPTGLDASRVPVYSGVITVTGGSVPLHQSYLGVAANMYDISVINTQTGPTLTDVNGNAIAKTTEPTYTYTRSGNSASWSANNYPVIQYKLRAGTPKINFDFVPADYTLPFNPTYSKRNGTDQDVFDFGFVESVLEDRSNVGVEPRLSKYYRKRATTTNSATASNKETFCGYNPPPGCSSTRPTAPSDTYSQTNVAAVYYLLPYQPRNTNNIEGDNSGSRFVPFPYVPIGSGQPLNGRYRILMRVLKVTGNPIVANDYESYLSGPMSIKPAT